MTAALACLSSGAILAFAVKATVPGLDLFTVAALGLALTILFWASVAPFTSRHDYQR